MVNSATNRIKTTSNDSALYEIELGAQREVPSSSGVIVSTGLGSTSRLRSVVTGSLGIAQALQAGGAGPYRPFPRDSAQRTFAVHEPFPSKTSGTARVYGTVSAGQPLKLRSRMPDHGVIFSDGMEDDFLRFTAGMEATITASAARGHLVV